MMKKLLFVPLLTIFLFAGAVQAQTPNSINPVDLTTGQANDLPDPGLLPDSPFYFLKSWSESIGTFFTFGDITKAERYAELAAKRIAEAKALVDKGRSDAAEKTLARYQYHLEKSLAKTEEARAKGKSVSEVTEIVGQATAKHLIVLEEVLEKIPEQAKSAVLRAREVSKTGQIKALEILSEENPEKAVNINTQTIQNRLEKVRNEAKKGNEESMERALADFTVLRTSLEKIGKENKTVLAGLILEDIIGQIERLDEVEDEVKNISFQMTERIEAVKTSAINGQVDVLRDLATVDPEKAAEIFALASEKRLNRAKQSAEAEDNEKTERSVKEFEKYAAFGQEISGIAQQLGKDTTTVEQLVARATAHHLEVLNDVYNKVPEQARKIIQETMTVSETGRQQMIDALKEKNALEDILEAVPLPQEVRERVLEGIKTLKPEASGQIQIQIQKGKVDKNGVEGLEDIEIEAGTKAPEGAGKPQTTPGRP